MMPLNEREQFLNLVDRMYWVGATNIHDGDDLKICHRLRSEHTPLPLLYCRQLRLPEGSTYAKAIEALIDRGLPLTGPA